MLGEFHFLYPLWLLALFPLALLLWLLRRFPHESHNAWNNVCDKHLLPHLLVHGSGRTSRLPLWLLAGGWITAVLALANPVWQKLPQPVLQTQDALVIVLDLSRSMLTPDLQPSRIAQARFKIADILKRRREGQTGLVVFAGDAFTVSPLTTDADTIAALLAALEPSIMPVQGSRTERGLRKAQELLRQAGSNRGKILLVTDGAGDQRTLQVVRESRAAGYPVSVLGVGTAAGAPLPTGDGGFAEDDRGNIVIPQLNSPALRALAVAGGGRYAPLSTDSTDLNILLTSQFAMVNSETQQIKQTTDRWREEGPWFVLLLLPLAALAFRRGWLLVFPLWISLLTIVMPESAWALEWRSLWERQEQQAARALAEGNFPRAAELAQDPLRRGIAEYRSGRYQAALTAFSNAQGADADYNRGNTLAKLGRLEEAIAAYDAALAKQPNMEDAKVNRTVVENWLRQQQQRQQPQQAHSQPNTASQNPRRNRNETSQTHRPNESSAQQHQNQQFAEGNQPNSQNHQNQANSAQPSEAQMQPPDRQSQTDGSQQSHHLSDPLQDSAQTTATKQQHPQETPDSPGQQQQAAAQASDIHQDKNNSQKSSRSITATAESLSTEEQQAVEQWLRRIPDDPGGLLRRKFLYQYQQRDAQPESAIDKDW